MCTSFDSQCGMVRNVFRNVQEYAWVNYGMFGNVFRNVHQGIIPLLPITVLKLWCRLVWISVSRLSMHHLGGHPQLIALHH